MTFRFVHTADLHLDSPLRSLALRDPELAALISGATRQALATIVDLCLAERVDALVIAGDLYDGEETSMKTARFLAGEMDRLHAANVRVFIVRGNHDSMSKVAPELTLPPNVKIFGERAETAQFVAGGLKVAVHGLSFRTPKAPRSLLPDYTRPIAGAVNIGVMHTSLGGAPGHDVYAPCPAAELHAWGFDYWALGHIHARSTPPGARCVVMPGMPQGRDINESGPKTATLVSIDDSRRLTLGERPTSLAEFARVGVDLSDAEDGDEAIAAIGRALEAAREGAVSAHLVARLKLSGATPLAWRLRRDPERLLAEAQRSGRRIGRVWIDKLECDVVAPTASAAAATPVDELRALIRDEIATSPGLREQARALVEKVRNEMPPDARDFTGANAGEFEAFLDALIVASGEDALARLAGGPPRPEDGRD